MTSFSIFVLSSYFLSLFFISLEAAGCSQPTVICRTNPCEESFCNVPGSSCKQNNCGTCTADWYLYGMYLTSSECISGACPSDTRLCDDGTTISRNPNNLCLFNSCPTPHPTPNPTLRPTRRPTRVPTLDWWESTLLTLHSKKDQFNVFGFDVYTYSIWHKCSTSTCNNKFNYIKKNIAVQYGQVTAVVVESETYYDDCDCSFDVHYHPPYHIDIHSDYTINGWFDYFIQFIDDNYYPWSIPVSIDYGLYSYPYLISRTEHVRRDFAVYYDTAFSDFVYFDSMYELASPVMEIEEDSYLFCGGKDDIECDVNYECIDDPRDECHPDCGGINCGGICVEKWNDNIGNDAVCAGISDIKCPINYTCYDDPLDDCNIKCNQGTKCKGFCAIPIMDSGIL